MAFFLLLEDTNSTKKNRYLWIIFTIAFICAILSKGIAAFLIAPGIFLYALYHKKLLVLLRSKEIYISSATIIFFGLGYYFLREHFNPGYIKAVQENELGGRYLTPMIESTPWEYIKTISNIQFKSWVPFAFIGIFRGLISTDSLQKRFTVFCTIAIVSLLVVISAGSTRLNWYDAPAFPLLSFLAGFGLYAVMDYLFHISEKKNYSIYSYGYMTLLILLFALPPYIDIITLNLADAEDPWDASSYNLTHYMEKRGRAGVNMDGYFVVNDWFLMRALFCQVKKWEYRGQKIKIIDNLQNLKPGDKVIMSHDPAKADINRLYWYEVIDTYQNVEVRKVLAVKTPS